MYLLLILLVFVGYLALLLRVLDRRSWGRLLGSAGS